MLPRESTLRQLKKLRSETKGTDIGDLTSNDKLNHNLPNLQYIGNPVDNNIDSYEDFTEKDNKLQTIAFKSKLVNKPLVKENNNNNKMKNKIEKFENFKIEESKDYESDYSILGKEKELKENPNFGIAAVKDQENKKIAFFNNFQIDPPTPKERPILNAGVSIDNDKVKGILNRIEGKNVYVESFDDPMTIKKFTLKDAVKTKKEK